MSFNKNGIISSNNIYEPAGKNLVEESKRGKSYTYTPGTGTNATLHPGFTVDLSDCTTGEKLYIRIKVDWSGFDTSNTAGTFAIWFQGDVYNATTNTWTWNTGNIIAGKLGSGGNITNTLLSATSGSIIFESVATVPSNYKDTITMARLGLRSDYSNGTGTITISDLEVIPEKYYTPSPESTNSGSALKIADDYIVANRLYEL